MKTIRTNMYVCIRDNFGYLYAFILILILYYSYTLIVLIFNNTHDVVEFDSALLNSYRIIK